MAGKVTRTDAEWRALLTPEQYAVARQTATERPFSGEYEGCWDAGTYVCVGCGQPLFDSTSKFNAGCGWPSFGRPKLPDAVSETMDYSHGMMRTEVVCSRCESHLGHVFDDGPAPTGLRYCINSVAMKFNPR